MKKIHFDNINRNWVLVSILILSILFLLVGILEPFENPKINKRIMVAGFLLQVVYYSKMFWYKNYVQWSKKGVVIRINSWTGKSLSFSQIKTSELNDKKLIVTKTNETKITFDLNDIAESDAHKLNEIIVRNTMSSTV